MDSGWIKIYRKLIEWEWFNDSKTLHVFLYLIIKANHKDGHWRGVDVKKGQLITGRLSISEATGISQQSVRTALANLIKTKEITSKPTSRFSIITICNYDTFQVQDNSINQPTNQQPTNNQPTTNQQSTTNKNERTKELKKEPKTIVRFTPPSLDEVKAYCIERKNTIDPEGFIAHYSANGWIRGKTKIKDWKACVVTWEKNQKKNDSSMKIGESDNSGRYRANDL